MPQILNPLSAVLRDPRDARDFSTDQWNQLLRQARRESMMARLGFLLQDAGLLDACPERAAEIMLAARAYVDFHHIQIKREIRKVASTLDGTDIALALLKGAAYLTTGLPLARGRRMADIDLLVPKSRLPAVEERLLQQGWEHQKLDTYDQRYYREWMHEIPPLIHPETGIEIDIHHALLPLTARVRPEPGLLWDASLPVGDGQLRVLAPTDMVLHTSAHLFYDGEIKGGLRDLVDLHLMLGDFGREPGFWTALPERAACLELTRPLFYALRYCSRLLGTQVPEAVLDQASRLGKPVAPVRAIMDVLVERVLTPRLPEERGAPLSAWLLYIRSHWLRMPPWLLAKHLSRKTWRRIRGDGA